MTSSTNDNGEYLCPRHGFRETLITTTYPKYSVAVSRVSGTAAGTAGTPAAFELDEALDDELMVCV